MADVALMVAVAPKDHIAVVAAGGSRGPIPKRLNDLHTQTCRDKAQV